MISKQKRKKREWVRKKKPRKKHKRGNHDGTSASGSLDPGKGDYLIPTKMECMLYIASAQPNSKP